MRVPTVEGSEEAVLLSFPFGEYHFRVICIERPSERLRAKLLANGYGHVCNNGAFYGDELWVVRGYRSTDITMQKPPHLPTCLLASRRLKLKLCWSVVAEARTRQAARRVPAHRQIPYADRLPSSTSSCKEARQPRAGQQQQHVEHGGIDGKHEEATSKLQYACQWPEEYARSPGVHSPAAKPAGQRLKELVLKMEHAFLNC